MRVGGQYLVIEAGEGSTLERGQVGKCVDFDGENLFHFEWDDGQRTFWPDGNGSSQLARLITDGGECDFCSSKAVVWRCKCRGTAIESVMTLQRGVPVEVQAGDEDDWAACDECKRFVERGDRARVAARCGRTIRRKNPSLGLSTRQAVEAAYEAQRMFWPRFTGEIVPIELERG